MLSNRMQMAAAGVDVGYVANAVNFDGTNDYLLRGGSLTGAADGKTGTISVWLDFQGGNGTTQYIFANGGSLFRLERNSSNKLTVIGFTSGFSQILTLTSTTSYTSTSGWIHFLAAWDLANTTGYLYVNDADDLASSTLTNGTIDYNRTDFAIGAQDTAIRKFNGHMSDPYINTVEYINISTQANRRLFIDAAGKPVDLGSDGSTPTGTAAIVKLSDDTATWHTNKGSGGGFTENGALTDAGTSPSD